MVESAKGVDQLNETPALPGDLVDGLGHILLESPALAAMIVDREIAIRWHNRAYARDLGATTWSGASATKWPETSSSTPAARRGSRFERRITTSSTISASGTR